MVSYKLDYTAPFGGKGELKMKRTTKVINGTCTEWCKYGQCFIGSYTCTKCNMFNGKEKNSVRSHVIVDCKFMEELK